MLLERGDPRMAVGVPGAELVPPLQGSPLFGNFDIGVLVGGDRH